MHALAIISLEAIETVHGGRLSGCYDRSPRYPINRVQELAWRKGMIFASIIVLGKSRRHFSVPVTGSSRLLSPAGEQ